MTIRQPLRCIAHISKHQNATKAAAKANDAASSPNVGASSGWNPSRYKAPNRPYFSIRHAIAHEPA